MGWFRRKTEHRQSSSYSDALVAALVRQANGTVDAAPTATGALEACSGAYGRALAVAEVTGGSAARAVTPAILSMVGRELVRTGDVVLLIEVDEGGVRLIPSDSWDVRGGYDPETWRYQVQLPGPDRSTTRTVPGDSVVHFRYATEPARPWKGLAPLTVATIAGRLDAELHHALGDEASGPRGSIIPTPKDGQDPTMVQLRADIKKLAGAVATVESTAASWDGDAMNSPRTDWGPRRLGIAWPAAAVEAGLLSAKLVMAACGVPVDLVHGDSDGTAQREAYRRFLHGTVIPVGKLVTDELRAKLDPELVLSFDELHAADIQGRARGFAAMVGAGEQPLIPVADARRLAGLE